MIDRKIKADLEKQGYRLVGNHSAVKSMPLVQEGNTRQGCLL